MRDEKISPDIIMPRKKKTKTTFANFVNPETYITGPSPSAKESLSTNEDIKVHVPFGLPPRSVMPTIGNSSPTKRRKEIAENDETDNDDKKVQVPFGLPSKPVMPTIRNKLDLLEAIEKYLGADRLSYNYVDIGLWDISKVSNFNFLFCDDRRIDTREKNDLVSGISNWNVEHVENMFKMFRGCTSFNQPLNWNVSNVDTMSLMFEDCVDFNSPLNWEGVMPSETLGMFKGCTNFNQPLRHWQMHLVTNFDKMFMSCSNFNSPLDWSGVYPTNLSGMFYGCYEFNQPLIDWNMSRVASMQDMFRDCRQFNQELLGWEMQRVKSMNQMFMGCTSFNRALDWRDVRPKYLANMFHGCVEYNQPLIGWDVSQVETMQSMFNSCHHFNQPLSGWDVSNVMDMTFMFNDCFDFNQDLTEWKVNSSCNFFGMFYGCSSLRYFPYWYMSMLEMVYPKTRNAIGSPAPPTIPQPTLIAGVNLQHGLPMVPPAGVTQFDRRTMFPTYWHPQEVIATQFLRTLSNREKALLKQYIKTDCFLEEVDCYVGNRLTTYLLRIHPEIIARYPEYTNPLELEDFSHSFPVSFDSRYMTQQKLLTILQGFRDLNVLLKRFPPLDATQYPHGFYLYRAQRYEAEIEKLAVGEEFILSKLTSTTMNVEVSAKLFATGVETFYNGRVETMGFLWRIKFPLGLPCAYIGNKSEEEVVLPLGTKLRYLGAWVQPHGSNAIYDSLTQLDTYSEYRGYVHGALICEFEVLEIVEGPLLQVLANAVNEDFARGNTAIYAKDLTLPAWMGANPNPNQLLRTRPIQPDEAFGKRNTHKRKPRRTIRRRKAVAHTAKRNKRRGTRKK
jgi:surface protein